MRCKSRHSLLFILHPSADMLRLGILEAYFVAPLIFRNVSFGKVVGFAGMGHPSVMVKLVFGMMLVVVNGAIFDRLFAEGVAFAFGPPCILMFIEAGLARGIPVSFPVGELHII